MSWKMNIRHHTIIVLTVTLLVSACQVNKRVKSKVSLIEVEHTLSLTNQISINDVTLLNVASETEKLKNKLIQFTPNHTTFINFGSYSSLAKVITVPINDNRLVIESYVTSTKTGELYLFYPVLTVFDNQKKYISLIKPRYEFEFNDNILRNHFTLPPDTKYIIIHTTPEFTGMSFTESNVKFKGPLIDPTGIAVATSVVTGVLVPVVGNPTRFTPTYTDFTLSIIGNIKIVSP